MFVWSLGPGITQAPSECLSVPLGLGLQVCKIIPTLGPKVCKYGGI